MRQTNIICLHFILKKINTKKQRKNFADSTPHQLYTLLYPTFFLCAVSRNWFFYSFNKRANKLAVKAETFLIYLRVWENFYYCNWIQAQKWNTLKKKEGKCTWVNTKDVKKINIVTGQVSVYWNYIWLFDIKEHTILFISLFDPQSKRCENKCIYGKLH